MGERTAAEDATASATTSTTKATAIYAAYFAGMAGNSIGMFLIGNGVITGVDIGGLNYNGTYLDKDGDLQGTLSFELPSTARLITGMTGDPDGPKRFDVPFRLPAGFADGRVITISTPTGPVNVRFEKLRDLR